jgi:hypothetical protein
MEKTEPTKNKDYTEKLGSPKAGLKIDRESGENRVFIPPAIPSRAV